MGLYKHERVRWHYIHYLTITPNLESEYMNPLLGLKLTQPNQVTYQLHQLISTRLCYQTALEKYT